MNVNRTTVLILASDPAFSREITANWPHDPLPHSNGPEFVILDEGFSSMTTNNRIVLSSDHAAIALRQAVAAHVGARGWVAVDIGPVAPESTHYPKHGEAAARATSRPAIAGLAEQREP